MGVQKVIAIEEYWSPWAVSLDPSVDESTSIQIWGLPEWIC